MLFDEALTLDQELSRWQETQLKHPDFKPRTVGHIPPIYGADPEVGYWPGRVDMYFDLYAASVWNLSRTARLLLMTLNLELSKRLFICKDLAPVDRDIIHLVEDVLASIPYHLTEDAHWFVRNGQTNTQITHPGKPVGGLLLMHPLYLISTLASIPQGVREYIKNCLSWIGLHMGIGQATVFAKVSNMNSIHGSLVILICIDPSYTPSIFNGRKYDYMDWVFGVN